MSGQLQETRNIRISSLLIAALLAAFPVGSHLAAADEVLTPTADGRPRATIVLAETPTGAAQLAAFELDGNAKKTATFTPPPIEVPEGFSVELVAGPPLVKYPMMAAMDERGRLFIAESDGQNLGKEDLLKQQPRFVRRLEDTDGDGRFDKSTIFADKLVMPEGGLWLNGSLYILSAPHLWRLDDTDGDGVADRREKLVGEMDLIGNANQHGPYLTPAGRLLFSGGTFGYNLVGQDRRPAIKGNWASVFSCRPDGTDVRVESHGGINPVEVEFTPEGEALGTCAIFDRVGGRCDALVHWVHGGTYAERLREPVLKQTGRFLPAAVRWGQVAPAGLVRLRGAHFGAEYQGNLFTCHFNTHELVRTRLERIGATFRGTTEPFLRSPSSDFHPADVLEDADGSLILIDTGAWLTMGCPTSKDISHGNFGGIYRIRRKDGTTTVDPRGVQLDWNQTPSANLIGRLADPRPAVADRAIAELVKRGEEATPQLAKAVCLSDETHVRRSAVWALARIGTASARTTLVSALADRDPSVRQAAVHAVGVLRERGAVERLVTVVVDDELPIRREAATALGLIGDPAAARAILESLGTAQDEFLEHALIYALIEMEAADAARGALADTNPRVQRGALIALDQTRGESLTREAVAPLLASTDANLQQAALDIVAKHTTWAAEIIGLVRESLSSQSLTKERAAILTGAVSAFAGNEQLQQIVAESLDRPETPTATLLIVLEAMGQISSPRLPETWHGPLTRLLSHGDESVRRQLLASLISFETKGLEKQLRAMAQDTALARDMRLAALSLVARGGGALADTELRFLVEQLRPDIPPVDRLSAAGALGAATLSPDQLESLLPVVGNAGPLELPSLLQAFETASHNKQLGPELARELGVKLIEVLAASPAGSLISPARIQSALAGFHEPVRTAAANRFPATASATTEQAARIAEIVTLADRGNVDAGRHLFFSNRAACAGCHRVGEAGRNVGPDLSRIAGIRTTRQLAEAIVLPSATLANGFETYLLVTQAGMIVSGLLRRETADAIHLV